MNSPETLKLIASAVEKIHSNFKQIASEADESLAYHFMYKSILAAAEEFRLMNICNALKDNPDLLKGYRKAYARADKILYREYLETQQNA